MPPKRDSKAPKNWVVSVQSSTCDNRYDPNQPLGSMICDAAKEASNGTISINDIGDAAGGGDDTVVVKNPDGSVTITAVAAKYLKTFHPTTDSNWHIGQAALDAFLLN